MKNASYKKNTMGKYAVDFLGKKAFKKFAKKKARKAAKAFSAD